MIDKLARVNDELLLTFLIVADEGNAAKVGRKLSCSGSLIIKRMRTLENIAGGKLFYGAGFSRLTPRGRNLAFELKNRESWGITTVSMLSMNKYTDDLSKCLNSLDKITIEAVAREISNRRGSSRVFIFGNGGSMAVASHLACDLSKNTRKPKTAPVTAVAFDSLPVMTALANDEGYGRVFEDQLEMHGVGIDDVVIGITTSGRSENVMRALHYAARAGATTVIITGSTDPSMDSFTFKILTVAPTIEMMEDLAGIVGHMLTVRVRELG